ncbi:hypothetical protein CBR_g41655 [Chara braunii]|uniref:Uncharacterized protein n=1 Tax=Chara braunii TaxID=69332 RepID=A0A388LW82_CHABU|nr:hypothetical protein CBR_g41655 [Chara braunii]|eukprot:GBG86590.1 hypothetical protein CBR_g41655 [Chara braunii]
MDADEGDEEEKRSSDNTERNADEEEGDEDGRGADETEMSEDCLKDILATLTRLMTRTGGAAMAQRKTRAVTGQTKTRGNPNVAARGAQLTRSRSTDK